MNFYPRTEPPVPGRGPAYWFVFQGDKLLVWPDTATPAGDIAGRPRLLLGSSLPELGLAPQRSLYLGYLEGAGERQIDCYAAEIEAAAPLPAGLAAEGLRALYPLLDETLIGLAGRAVQLVAWDRTHRFCGQCGALTETMANERAKRCPNCGLVSYPRLSPAIIIAIVRQTEQGPELLLARNHRFPQGRYSVLAGYVEPGETLEECAQREVREEVGIDITNICYFGSQPWPFPNSLMIGFTADYVSGELQPEAGELADARWFAGNALPDLPPRFAIARRLIDWFIESSSNTP